MEALKPCPFCGGNDLVVLPIDSDRYKVSCEECNISVECGNGIGEDTVINAWNKRCIDTEKIELEKLQLLKVAWDVLHELGTIDD